MSLGIALGLGAALAWGFSDFVAARTSREAGALRVVLGFHLCATVLLVLVAVATGALDDVGSQDVAFFVLVGAAGWLAYVTFFKALAIGPISVVSPIVSGYAAVTVLLAVIVSGERLSAAEIAAIALTMVGVVVAATNPGAVLRERAWPAAGIALAVVTMILIGGFVFGVAYRSHDLGWLGPIVLVRLFTTIFVGVHAARAGAWTIADLGRTVLVGMAVVAFLDTTGFVFFNVGVRHEDTTIVATASAPYALVPIALGVLLLRERPSGLQWSGIALVIAGVMLLGLVSG